MSVAVHAHAVGAGMAEGAAVGGKDTVRSNDMKWHCQTSLSSLNYVKRGMNWRALRTEGYRLQPATILLGQS